MHPDSRALLWDAMRAIAFVRDFTDGRSFEDYRADVLLRSAVERQLQIVGEALNRLSRIDPDVAARIPDLPRIVGFRNIVVHGYASLNDALVWEIISDRIGPLEQALHEVAE